MLVASGDQAPLEHGLGASQKQSLSQRITTWKIVGSNTSMLTQHKGLWLKSSFRKRRNYQKFVFAKNMLNVHFVNLSNNAYVLSKQINVKIHCLI